MWNITAGNTIYPINSGETQKRRDYQTAAIIACEQLQQEFMYCKDVLPVKASAFAPYIDHIDFEIKLLKGWRRANAKLETQIADKESGGKVKE
jgi:hypothetical protein